MSRYKEKKFILIGTYKTNDEKCGWYINEKRYKILWDKLFEKFGDFDRKKISFDGKFGNIENVKNFHFYDLVKYDSKILTTKDKEVFKITDKKIECTENLKSLIDDIKSNPNQEYRIGLQGNNSVGIFLNYLNNNERLMKVSISTISKYYKNIEFGEIKINDQNLQNLKVFKIFNLTQPAPSHNDLKTIFHDSWNEFLEINN
jgi:hypothetical protein